MTRRENLKKIQIMLETGVTLADTPWGTTERVTDVYMDSAGLWLDFEDGTASIIMTQKGDYIPGWTVYNE